MSENRASALLSGVGLIIEDAERASWGQLESELISSGNGAIPVRFDGGEGVGGRDGRLLSKEDRMSLQAAVQAIDSAFGAPLPPDRRWGCVSFTTTKLTRASETGFPFVAFRKDDGSIDTVAFRSAVDTGEILGDPLELLRQLDNNVCWWLCKKYGFGGVSLQLGQSVAPDFWALVAAIDLIDRGECDAVLIGGASTIDQSSINWCAFTGKAPAEDDLKVGGGAVFFVLEREDCVESSAGRLRLGVDFDELQCTSRLDADREFGSPALTTALGVLRASMEMSGLSRSQTRPAVVRSVVGDGAFWIEQIP